MTRDAFSTLPRKGQELFALQAGMLEELSRITGEHRLPKVMEHEFRRLTTSSLAGGQVDLRPVFKSWLEVCAQMEHVHSVKTD